jgi:kynurenine formamidase
VETADESTVLSWFEKLSNWGRWGPDDELGTMNLITAGKIAAAAKLVRSGRSVSCSRPITPRPVGGGPPFLHFMFFSGDRVADDGMAVSADWIGLSIHGYTYTHIDALSHIFWNAKMYNGRSADLVSTAVGARAGAIDLLQDGIVSRGILLDIPRYRGVPHLQAGDAIMPEDLTGCEEMQNLKVEPGDVLLIRTGKDLLEAPRGYENPEFLPGLQAACLPWLHERGVAILGSDAANDVMPSGYKKVNQPVHAVALVAMGLWLIDNAYLEKLAEACADAKRWQFMFVTAPLRLKNSTGSPLNPIAIF